MVLGSWSHAEVELSAKEVVDGSNSRLQATESEGKALGSACTPKASSQTCHPRVCRTSCTSSMYSRNVTRTAAVARPTGGKAAGRLHRILINIKSLLALLAPGDIDTAGGSTLPTCSQSMRVHVHVDVACLPSTYSYVVYTEY